jgi:hypothetical protein
MIVKPMNLSYLSLSCYDDINNRNILFHCFRLSGYRHFMTHAQRDEIAMEASQPIPNRIRYLAIPMTKTISVMKVIISEI